MSVISLIAEEGKEGGLWIEDDDDNDDDDVDDNDHEERRVVYRAMQTKCELNILSYGKQINTSTIDEQSNYHNR